MPQEPLPENIHVNIKSLRLLAFNMNESVELPFPEQRIINLKHQIIYSMPDLTITMDLTISFSTPALQLFMECSVRNIFTVLELPSMLTPGNEDQINIPNNVLAVMLGLSVSHTRALMAQSALGSKFQDVLIPIVNPVDLVSQLIPAEISTTTN